MNKRISLGVLLLLWTLSATARSESTWYASTRPLYYGIPVTVRFSPADPALAAQVWAYLERMDDVFNDYRTDSEVGRIDAMPEQQQVVLSDDLAQAMTLAGQVHHLTRGAFDPTLGAVRALWQHGEAADRLPTAAEIDQALRHSGFDRCRLLGTRLTVSGPPVQFDFGGLCKGMFVDHAAAMLRQAGVRSALVQVGGETTVFGVNPEDDVPTLGIEDPLNPGTIWTRLVATPSGLCATTSANTYQATVIHGRPYYHIYNPRSGHPVDTDTLSVSVVFRGGGHNGLADGMAKGGMILAPGVFLSAVHRCGGEAVLLRRGKDGVGTFKTPGWDGLCSTSTAF